MASSPGVEHRPMTTSARRLLVCLSLAFALTMSHPVKGDHLFPFTTDASDLFIAADALTGNDVLLLHAGVLCLAATHCAITSPVDYRVFFPLDIAALSFATRARLTKECQHALCAELVRGHLTPTCFVVTASYRSPDPLPPQTERVAKSHTDQPTIEHPFDIRRLEDWVGLWRFRPGNRLW